MPNKSVEANSAWVNFLAQLNKHCPDFVAFLEEVNMLEINQQFFESGFVQGQVTELRSVLGRRGLSAAQPAPQDHVED
jgi:hypothetical protein